MKTNVLERKPVKVTHEGAVAYQHNKPIADLRRSVLSCLLWEQEFYESGTAIADRIQSLAAQCKPEDVASLAIEARSEQHLRHVPLLLLVSLLKIGKGAFVGDAIAKTIQRADELAELLSLYWKINGKDKPIAKQLKRGLALAFPKFNAYSLAKYNRDGAVKLRDVLFLCYPKSKDEEQKEVWKKLAEDKLESPDTWEVELSAGKDKKETFERLVREEKLGYFALLRNLRNMRDAGCDMELVKSVIIARKSGADKILPFRFVAAARACPQLEPALDESLLSTINDLPKFSGTTCVLVDVSGSMDSALSGKSDLKRMDAAATLAAIIPGSVRMLSFSNNIVEVPPRKGMAGTDAIIKSQGHGGTECGKAVQHVFDKVPCERLIVITDEQSHDRVPQPPSGMKAYMINVASNKNGVGYGKWVHIDGFSENVIRFIHEAEKSEAAQQ